MDLKLNTKKALVTGSTAGIGYAIARELAQEGATVIINGRKTKDVEAKVEKLKKETGNTQVLGIAADFSKKHEIQALLDEVSEVDILINNVGMFKEVEFGDITDEEWLEIFEVNAMSGIRMARHYFSKMLERNEGRIVFISSESALNIPTEMIHYGMSKTAQLAISRGLARLTKGTHVTVNAVLPGPTKSRGVEEMLRQQSEANNKAVEEVEKEFFSKARPTSLIQRFADPEEVARLVAYVASPLSSATNGAALRVDGGVVNSIL
ncbi:MAG TPA: oxidoreductase [Cryomorphaceae bacterium]|nr:oxidoreductase [Cryomorphaceae bacterium]